MKRRKMKTTNFNDYQTQAHSTALYLEKIKEIFNFTNLPKPIMDMLAISYVELGMGEVGEIQNKLKKIIRDKGGEVDDKCKEDIKKELGDVLWYVAEMCTLFNLNMDDVAQANLDKLFKRKEEGKLQGSGDNR